MTAPVDKPAPASAPKWVLGEGGLLLLCNGKPQISLEAVVEDANRGAASASAPAGELVRELASAVRYYFAWCGPGLRDENPARDRMRAALEAYEAANPTPERKP